MKRIIIASLLTAGMMSAQAGIIINNEPVEPSPPYIPNTNLFDIVFDDEPLDKVVTEFTRAADINIVATPADLQGSVTVNLSHVQWRPALEAILEMHCLVLEQIVTNANVFQITHGPDYPEVYEYEYSLADTIFECMPNIFLYWLLALLIINPVFALVVFKRVQAITKEDRPLGGPALWAYAVLAGGLPVLIMFWWIHKDMERKTMPTTG